MIEGQIRQATEVKPKGRVAILADGENLSFKEVETLMRRIEGLGDPTILRAYCNRIDPKGWDRDHRFQVTYLDTISGKNSADIRLVIDAMDIAHTQPVDAFVILSSDCDFAALAHRLRSFGHWVLGAGRAETSLRFRLACSEFLVVASEESEQGVTPKQATKPATAIIPPVRKILKESKQPDGWFTIAWLGKELRKIIPEFDPNWYGAKSLTDLIQTCGYFDLMTHEKHGVQLKVPEKAAKVLPHTLP